MASNDVVIGALAASDSDISDGDASNNEDSVAQQMSQLLPLNATYNERKHATTAIRYASIRATGHGVRVDRKGCNTKRAKYVCARSNHSGRLSARRIECTK